MIVRHAHRFKNPSREADNGLSPKGIGQAEKIVTFFQKRFKSGGVAIVSSPKMRCLETVQPLANLKRRRIKTLAILDEGGDLPKKAAEFLNWWKIQKTPRLVICSHGDWIPVFLKAAIGAEVDMKKGAWAELELDSGEIQLRWLLQKL